MDNWNYLRRFSECKCDFSQNLPIWIRKHRHCAVINFFFFFLLLCSLLKWSFVCNLNQHSFSTLKIENVKMPHRDIIVQSKNSLAETENEWNQFNPNETRKWHDIPRKINLAWCVTVNLQLYDKWLCSCVCFSAKRHSNSIQFNKEKKMHDLLSQWSIHQNV